jgi:hypothetical protein
MPPFEGGYNCEDFTAEEKERAKQKYIELKAKDLETLREKARPILDSRKREQEGRLIWSQPWAQDVDYEYYSKFNTWNIAVGIALIFGKNPKELTPKRMQESYKQDPYPYEFRELYFQCLELAWNHFGDSDVSIDMFLDWARDADISVPCELEVFVKERISKGLTVQKGESRQHSPTATSLEGSTESAEENLFKKEGEIWTVRFNGETGNFKNTKGFRYIEYLICDQGKEFLVSDLYFAINPPDIDNIDSTHSNMGSAELGGEGLSVADLGDAEKLLSPEGKAALKQEVTRLKEQINRAKERRDEENQAALEDQLDEILEYFAAQTGLGGKTRKASNDLERLRKSVSKCIRGDINKIKKTSPELGHHLGPSIHTGTYCSYSPHPRVNWRLS